MQHFPQMSQDYNIHVAITYKYYKSITNYTLYQKVNVRKRPIISKVRPIKICRSFGMELFHNNLNKGMHASGQCL